MTSSHTKGGFEDRFRVTKTDGSPIREDARYFVLDYGGADPHAKVAMAAYAQSVRSENSDLASDLFLALDLPARFPKQHE